MDSISVPGNDFDPIVKLLGAFILAMPIAWHREKHSRIVGLRTFPLVSVGCCAYILIGTTAFGASVAYGYWYYAMALAVINFFIVALLSGLKTQPDTIEIDDYAHW